MRQGLGEQPVGVEAEPLCRGLQVVDDQQPPLYGPVAEGDLRASLLGTQKKTSSAAR